MLFAFYGKASHDYEKSEYIKCCGRYDLYIVYASDEDIEKYRKDDVCLFNYKYLDDDIFLIKSQPDYLDFSEYQLVEGEFPENSSEIICEPWFLIQKGLTDSEMLGSCITVDNNNYTVSGLIEDTSYTIDDDPTAMMITTGSAEPNAFMLCLGDSASKEESEKLIDSIVKTSPDCLGKINLDKYSLLKQADTKAHVIFFIFWTLCAFVMMMMYNVINFYILGCLKEINNFLLIGVSKENVRSALILCFGIVFAFSDLIAYINCLSLSKLINIKNPIFVDQKYSGTLFDAFKQTILFFLIIFIIQIIITSISCKLFFKVRHNKETALIRKYTDQNPQKRFKNPFLSLGYNNFRSRKKVNIITIIAISLSVTIASSFLYFLDINNDMLPDYDDVNYIIKFQNEFKLSDDEKIEKIEIIDRMENNDSIDAYIPNEYYTSLSVPQKELNSDYIESLKETQPSNNFNSNKYKSNVNIPVALISADVLNINDLANNEGIIYVKPLNSEASESFTFKGQSKSFKVSGYDGEQDIILKKADICPLKLYNDNVLNIIVVNNDLFNKLSYNQTPDRIYIRNNANIDNVIKTIGGNKFTKIENVNEETKNYHELYYNLEKQTSFLCFICIICLTISFIISSLLTYLLHKKEYLSLTKIGVSIKKIFCVLFFEFMLLFIPILTVSVAFLYLASKIIFKIITDPTNYNRLVIIKYSYPFSFLAFILSAIVILSLFSYLFTVIALKRSTKNS